ncbi:immunoglobulin superfamily member 3-like [Rhinoraja longicauda]
MELPRSTSLKFLIFSLILSFETCFAQRKVILPEGPLYRAEGRHVTMQCEVRGTQLSQEQSFEWSVALLEKPTWDVQIISSHDPGYTYAVYSQRVASGEIYVERITNISVRLHITNLRKSDTGKYACHTPNMEDIYWGSYNAFTKLTVIPDTLSATLVPQVINKVEGDSLELVCEVSKQTPYHTHVAVTWYLEKGGQEVPVISLTRDFILSAGELYKQRQASGDVRLDKIGATSFRLTIHNLQRSEQGQFNCQSVEWLQDPDKSWQELSERRTHNVSVNVRSLGKEFRALIKAKEVNINVGGSLEITCMVEARNPTERFFTVLWFLNNDEVVRMGPSAVLSFHGEYGARENSGKLAVRKKDDKEYILKLYQIKLEDGGSYRCQVEESEKVTMGAFSSNRSEEIVITVQRPQADLRVEISINATEILEGDVLEFACNVHSGATVHGQLSVIWQFTDKHNVKSDIIEMQQNGVQVTAPPYHERVGHGEVRMARVGSDTFTLGIYDARISDEGLYSCKVMKWTVMPNQHWKLIGDYVSSDQAVRIKSLESIFKVIAITRTPNARYYGTFELQCYIQPSIINHLPIDVSWKFQPANSNESFHLVTFSHDTAIEWGDKAVSFKGKMIVAKTASNTVRLRVSRVSSLEAGKFLCNAVLWKRQRPNQWVRIVSAMSNILQVVVQAPVSRLQLAQGATTIRKRVGDVIELDCKIFAQTQNDSQFSVSWLFHESQRQKERTLLNIDRNNIIQYDEQLRASDREWMKMRVEKTLRDLYKLIIGKAEVTDQGNYFCEVSEWLLDPNNVWYKVSKVISAVTTVQVHTPDANLQVADKVKHVSVQEDAAFEIECVITNQTRASSQFSVTWFFQNEGQPKASRRELLHTDRDNIQHYRGDLMADSHKSTLQSAKVSSNNYKLIMTSMAPADSGVYYCSVEEWVTNGQNQWALQGSDESGRTTVQVQPSAVTLHTKACASSSLFYFLFVYPFIIFIALSALAVYFYMNRKKPQKSSQENNLWTPIKPTIDDLKNEEDTSVI